MDWAFLSPWWRVIQAYEPTISRELLPHSLQSRAHRGLSVRLPPRSLATSVDDQEYDMDHACTTLRDALELVLLLSIVDHSAFTTMLCESVNPNEKSTTKCLLARSDADELASSLRVELIRTRTRSLPAGPSFAEWILSAAAALLVPQPLEMRSQEFRTARSQILSAIPEDDTETRAACATMAITIGIGAACEDLSSTILPAMVSIIYERRSLFSTGSGTHGFPFRAAEFDATVLLSSNTLAAIAQINANRYTQHGRAIRFRYLSIQHRTMTQDEMAYGNMLVALCRPIACAVRDPKPPRTTLTATTESTTETPTSMTLSPSQPHTRGSIQQLWLALMYSRTIQSLHIAWPSRETPRHRQHHIQWLMHALFSKWSRHAIQHVVLSRFDPTDTDVDELRAFLARNEPTASLLQRQSTRSATTVSGDATQVHVAANTTVSMHPVSIRRPKTIVLPEAAWLDVSVDRETDAEYSDVVVPAYGLCRLRRVDILKQRVFENYAVSSDDSDGHGVTSLELTPSHWAPQLAPVCDFLRIVGRPLRTLSLEGRYLIDATFWETLFKICPAIECVKLRQVQMETLVHVLDSYASGCCTVTKLALEMLYIPDDDQGMIAFFQALADPSTRISQTLCELSFGFNPMAHYALEDDEVDAITKMLHTNKTLRFVALHLESYDYDDIDQPSWEPGSFVEFDNQYIPNASDPMGIRAKCAFLSVAGAAMRESTLSESSTSTTRPQAISQLDSFVLTLIFTMAAEPIRRRVDVFY